MNLQIDPLQSKLEKIETKISNLEKIIKGYLNSGRGFLEKPTRFARHWFPEPWEKLLNETTD